MRHWDAAAPGPGAAHRTTDDQLEDDVHATLIAAAEGAAEHASSLPFPPAVFGIGAFVGLVAMLLATYAFRSVGTRH